MKTKLLLFIALSLLIAFSACQSNQNQSDYCTVKGTVKGLPNGAKLELLDAFNQWEVVGTGSVKKGAFEIHPDVSSPTHVYLYVQEGMQLKDFILEPGTILVEVDANNEEDLGTGAKGTPSNEIDYKYYALSHSGNQEAAQAIKDSVLNAKQTGALALANMCALSFLPMHTAIADGGTITVIEGIILLLFSYCKNKKIRIYAWAVMCLLINVGALAVMGMQLNVQTLFFDAYEWLSVFSIILMLCYNGGRGKGNAKLFYWFYPAHVYVLYGLSFILYMVMQ